MIILTAILSFFGAIFSVIKNILSAIPPTGWLMIGCVIIGMLLVNRGCSCRRAREPRQKKIIVEFYNVNHVLNGVTIEVKVGIFGRRTKIISLWGVSCPCKGLLADEAKKNLELKCGEIIKIKRQKGSDFYLCLGETGIDLSLDQLEHGFAKCLSGCPKQYLEAEGEAKKLKLGIWSL